MPDSYNLSPRTENSRLQPYTGPERRADIERRRTESSTSLLARDERRTRVRRKVDRLFLEAAGLGAGGRSSRRVRMDVPVLYRPLAATPVSRQPARHGVTHTLAAGGLSILLEEELRVGMGLEVLIRFGGDLLAADVEVVSALPQAGKILHGCRFTRLSEGDRKWLTEQLRKREALAA